MKHSELHSTEGNQIKEDDDDEDDERVSCCDVAVISGSQSPVTRHWLLTACHVRTHLPSQRGSVVMLLMGNLCLNSNIKLWQC